MSDLISREAAAAREVFAGSCSAAKEAIDYLEQLLLRAQPATPAGDIGNPMSGDPVTLTYRNWRGEVAARSIIPRRVWFGSTDWHTEPQWLLTAWDAEKQAERDFALKDFGQPVAQEPVARPPFAFDRYINGQLMAEGVRIERQATLSDAMVAAAKLASRGPNGEVPVLVYAHPAAPAPVEAGLREAFEAGAMSVHHEWVGAHGAGEGPPRGDPAFSEAASDYAALRAQSAPVTALARESAARAAKVKPLEWKFVEDHPDTDTLMAGDYEIWAEGHGYQLLFWSIVQGEPHRTLADAQAAAWAHHESRILAALEGGGA